MCYHCATNPSIHHHCRCVAAISSLLSHHGVTFTVTSSWFRRCHCDVTFIVALSWCHCCCRGVTFMLVMVSSSPSRCCLCRHIVMVLSLSWCCLHHRIVAVSSSWFYCRHCSVAFIVALSRCCRCSHVVVVPSLLHHC